MKKSYKSSVASLLASELLEYGMIFGNELEWFIKTSVDGYIKFTSDIDYLKFEDLVLEYVEKRSNKSIVLEDLLENKTKIYTEVKYISKFLNVSDTAIYNALNNKHLLKKRYKAYYKKIKLY